MATTYGQNTPTEPEGPQALPGKYQVRLTVGGKSLIQSVEIMMDPRVKPSSADLQKQFALEMKIYNGLQQASQAWAQIGDFLKRGNLDQTIAAKASSIAGTQRPGAQEAGGESNPATLARVDGMLARLAGVVDSADAAPTAQATKAVDDTLAQLQSLLAQWESLKQKK